MPALHDSAQQLACPSCLMAGAENVAAARSLLLVCEVGTAIGVGSVPTSFE